MARIKDESVERVKAAMEILPLVEDVVRLRKAGSTYKGLCPFHQERTPSFTVSPARGTFKCFGCGEGGDAITFVEKTENVDFVGAIELLARRFGVELEYEEVSPEQEQKRRRDERLRALLERAAEFYARVLWDAEAGSAAREYLASRGLGESAPLYIPDDTETKRAANRRIEIRLVPYLGSRRSATKRRSSSVIGSAASLRI